MRPIIFVSKCLGFEACRYSGQIVFEETVKNLRNYVEFVTVCPEVEIGLSTPRNRLSLIKDELIEHKTNKNLTKQMKKFSKNFLSKINNIDGAILMSRSPSCSIFSAKIYERLGNRHRNGEGIFGKALKEKFPNIPIEEKGRLDNYNIRNNFLIKIFLLKRFKENKSLQEFQKTNKFLLMSFDKEIMTQLEEIVSQNNKKEYKKKLNELMKKNQKRDLLIDIFTQIYQFMKNKISKEEEEYVINLIEKFREEKVPKIEILAILKELAIRFNDKDLLNQTIFSPYPEEIEILNDSGKGRDL